MSKFQLVLADPAWVFFDTLSMSNTPRGAAANYQLLNTEDIKNLKIQEIADPDGCLLALWVPSSLIQNGLDVMKAWGFDMKQTYIWVKIKKDPFKIIKQLIPKTAKQWLADNIAEYISANEVKPIVNNLLDKFSMSNILDFNMGRLFRQTHEICLIGTNNNKIYQELKNKSQRSVSFGENLRHSAKPEHLQDSLELMFPEAKKIELFARRERPGWVSIGNELREGEDIRVSIDKIINLINENAAA